MTVLVRWARFQASGSEREAETGKNTNPVIRKTLVDLIVDIKEVNDLKKNLTAKLMQQEGLYGFEIYCQIVIKLEIGPILDFAILFGDVTEGCLKPGLCLRNGVAVAQGCFYSRLSLSQWYSQPRS